MNTRLRWAITLLMTATLFRVQTLTLLPDLEMFDGSIPDAWFAPLLSDAIIGLLVPVMVYLFWTKRGTAVWGALVVYNAVGAFDYSHGLATQWTDPIPAETASATTVYLGIGVFMVFQLIALALLFRSDVRAHFTVGRERHHGVAERDMTRSRGTEHMLDLERIRSMLLQEHGLAVVSTTQSDGRVLSSVVNCGVIDHPITGEPRVAFVSMGRAARVGHIRRGSQVTVLVRRDWKWISVTGPADLIGPDDLRPGIDHEAVRLLLRDVFKAAGGTHDDFDEYDRAMADEARLAVFVAPDRILGVAP